MIIVDTNVWIDHLRRLDPALTAILQERRQRVHPFVIGELALGSVANRQTFIGVLRRMPQAIVATHVEVMWLIEDQGLHGRGIGYVDAHLLASARLMPGTSVWTRDKRLSAVCDRLGLAFQPSH